MDSARLLRARRARYRISRAQRLRTMPEAARYIQRVGMCWLFAPRERALELPSLFEAVKGRFDAHIDDWDADSDRLWAWKNDLPAARRAYYGKALAGRPCFISLQLLPAAMAALGVEEVGQAYAHGAIHADAKRVYDTLSRYGAQPTQTLRRNSGFAGHEGKVRFHKALEELQRRLIALPMGATSEGLAWPSQIFELVSVWFPAEAEAARTLELDAARSALVLRYLATVIAAPPETLMRLFTIPRPDLTRLLDELARARKVRVADGWVIAARAPL